MLIVLLYYSLPVYEVFLLSQIHTKGLKMAFQNFIAVRFHQGYSYLVINLFCRARRCETPYAWIDS